MSYPNEADNWQRAGQVGPSQPQAFGRTARQAAAAMFLLNGGLFGVWASRIPSFVDRLQISPSLLGLLLLCMAAGGIASFPVAGRLSDRYGASVIARHVSGQ